MRRACQSYYYWIYKSIFHILLILDYLTRWFSFHLGQHLRFLCETVYNRFIWNCNSFDLTKYTTLYALHQFKLTSENEIYTLWLLLLINPLLVLNTIKNGDETVDLIIGSTIFNLYVVNEAVGLYQFVLTIRFGSGSYIQNKLKLHSPQ